jgi:hypothetical protein
MDVTLTCYVDEMRFRRFNPREINGVLRLQPNQAQLQNLSLLMAGGRINLDARIDAAEPQRIKVNSTGRLVDTEVDSLFYLFHDFGQTALQSKQIKGTLKADYKAEWVMDNRLAVSWPSMEMVLTASLAKGQLLGFAPLQALSRFFKEEELAHLRFEELHNTFTISHERITVPEMEIRSSLLSLYIMGWQQFDQLMEYRVRLPLRNFKKADADSRFGQIVEDKLQNGNLLLVVRGTPDNLLVSFDKQAIREKVKQGLQREKQELLDLFRRKPRGEMAKPTPPQTGPDFLDLEEDGADKARPAGPDEVGKTKVAPSPTLPTAPANAPSPTKSKRDKDAPPPPKETDFFEFD